MKKIKNFKLKIGDPVQIITGDDKGKTSEIIKINKKKGKITVKNLNLVTKHLPSQNKEEKGEIKKIERQIDISNVMFFDTINIKKTRLSYIKKESLNLKKKKTRITKKTNLVIKINDFQSKKRISN